MTTAEFLDRLERARRSGAGWTARCPAHDDRHPSLSVRENDGRILLHCFAGCTTDAIVAALGLEMHDLFTQGEGDASIPHVQRPVVRLVRVDGQPVDETAGLTLDQLADAKQLRADLLSRLGCETVYYFGPPAVQIPYTDEDGNVVGIRYRLALVGDATHRWRKGTKATTLLYGASRLAGARKAGYVILVEGESDAWTLMQHGFPVVSLPGAGMWQEEHAARLDGIEVVYVLVEPDRGGEMLVAKLRDSVIRPRVRLLRLPTKDASELHLHDEASFKDRFREALNAATTLLAVEEERRQAEAAAELERCRELALEPEILAAFDVELRARGFVGPTGTAKLIFLVLVSRLLRRPVSLVLRGLSSAGKSYTVESVLPFFPASAYFDRSGMSERALVYTEEDFRHRVLYIAEADAIAGEGLGAYFLRTLISENKLVYETVEKDGDRLVTRVIEKPGPTAVILTTTRLRLHDENENRMLGLTVPDDPELTRQIMRAIAIRDDEAAADAPAEAWRALQRWLELAGERRVTDQHGFLLVLADIIPAVAVRLRRDFALVRSLVFAHALLHQANRARDERGRILATLADYAAVRDLIADILAEGIGATVSDHVRATVAAVAAAIGKAAPETTVRRSQVQAELELDDRATRRRLAQAVEAGFVVNTNSGRGKTALYALGDRLPDDVDVLPPADALRQAGDPDDPDNLASSPRDRYPPPPDAAVIAALSLDEALLDPNLRDAFGIDGVTIRIEGAVGPDPERVLLERHEIGPHAIELWERSAEPGPPPATVPQPRGEQIGTCIRCGAGDGDGESTFEPRAHQHKPKTTKGTNR